MNIGFSILGSNTLLLTFLNALAGMGGKWLVVEGIR